jgi:hypothetical protein
LGHGRKDRQDRGTGRRRITTKRRDPNNAGRAALAGQALAAFAELTDSKADLRADPQAVLVDLLADLMHLTEPGRSPTGAQTMSFEPALKVARRHYREERQI